MASTQAQAEMLANRLAKRQKHLRKWARRTGTDAYRLYDRDIPEIPLLIDWYAGAVSLSLYKRPYEKDEAEEAVWLAAMKTAAANALVLNEDLIFCRERKHLRAGQGTEPVKYGKLADKHFERDVHEGDLTFQVNLSDYLDTGLFLDRRKFRTLVRNEASGKRVLNLFCYTGAFSVCAAMGKAAQVDSVDLSAAYLEWARENFRLNGLITATAGTAERFRFIRADVLRFIEEARRSGKHWDMIILDPPAFSNSKKMSEDFDLKRDHVKLLAWCLHLLAPGAALYLSANVKGFKLDSETLLGDKALTIEDISEKLRDEDFLDRRIPACYVFQKTDSST
jgi:23S rRNA G2069 N7-methylase RlmK/C1962 C5-methylase RlmI